MSDVYVHIHMPKNSNHKTHIENQAYLLHSPQLPPSRQQSLPDYSALQTTDTFQTLFFYQGFQIKIKESAFTLHHLNARSYAVCFTYISTFNLHDDLVRFTCFSPSSGEEPEGQEGKRLAQGHQTGPKVTLPSSCPESTVSKVNSLSKFPFRRPVLWNAAAVAEKWMVQSRALRTQTSYHTFLGLHFSNCKMSLTVIPNISSHLTVIVTVR